MYFPVRRPRRNISPTEYTTVGITSCALSSILGCIHPWNVPTKPIENAGLVKEVMGHESLSTTMGYLHPETVEIKVVIDRLNQHKYVV